LSVSVVADAFTARTSVTRVALACRAAELLCVWLNVAAS
jgi:hypothetical protein